MNLYTQEERPQVVPFQSDCSGTKKAVFVGTHVDIVGESGWHGSSSREGARRMLRRLIPGIHLLKWKEGCEAKHCTYLFDTLVSFLSSLTPAFDH
jgi:hypothetical protein